MKDLRAHLLKKEQTRMGIHFYRYESFELMDTYKYVSIWAIIEIQMNH